ncbi:unnamed protein product [Lepidochelys kempii]
MRDATGHRGHYCGWGTARKPLIPRAPSTSSFPPLTLHSPPPPFSLRSERGVRTPNYRPPANEDVRLWKAGGARACVRAAVGGRGAAGRRSGRSGVRCLSPGLWPWWLRSSGGAKHISLHD